MAEASATIGGFIGLELGGDGGGVFETAEVLAFRNARAGLTHLLEILGPRRVWVPAYVCPEVAQAAGLHGREVRFYGVGPQLEPDVDALATAMSTGDAVIGVDYFGAPARGLPALAQRFPDVAWIEDRAQALWPADRAWGRYLLYSPRKVVGVADGGILVSMAGAIPKPLWVTDGDVAHLMPALRKLEDPERRQADTWFAAYRDAEAAMTADPLPMSRISRGLLAGVDPPAIAARRRSNAAALMAAVKDHLLWPAERLLEGAPLGVPVLTSDAETIARRMAAEGVFCARHWPALPSPAAAFPAEHALSRRLLTLPCDQRYGPADMERVAAVFRACL